MRDPGTPPPPPPPVQPPGGPAGGPPPRTVVTESTTTTGVVEKTGPPPVWMFLIGFVFGGIIGFAVGLVLWHTTSSSPSGFTSAGVALVQSLVA